MKTNYTIKNFRVFGEDGANIELAPLTILTGCNSSGKSSIVKSILLADSFLKRVKNDYAEDNSINLASYKLDFTKYPNNLLGNYSHILNHSAENEEVIFAYTKYSRMLGSDIKVELTFAPDKNDILDNGYIKSIKLYYNEKILYFLDPQNKSWVNINLLLDAFLDFVQIQALTNNLLGLQSEYDIEGSISKEEYETEFEKLKVAFKQFPRDRKQDVFGYLRFEKWDNIIPFDKLKKGILEPIIETGSLCFIPLFRKLSGLSKDEQIENLNNLIQKENDLDLRTIYNRLVEAFRESSFESVADYFLESEKAWRDKVDLGQTKGTMRVNNCAIKIPQEHLKSSPKHTVGTLDNNGNILPLKAKDIEDEMYKWLNEELTFPIIYSIFMRINSINLSDEIDTIHYKVPKDKEDCFDGYTHLILPYLSLYVGNLIEEILCPEWSNHISFVSSSRVDIRRMYDIQNDTDFAKLLRSYYEYNRTYKNYLDNYYCTDKRSYEPNSFMNKWVKKFGIGEEIKIIMDEDGAGVKIRLYKADGKSSLLADEGYGITQLMSVLLQIECAIQAAENVKVNKKWGQSMLDGYNTDQFHYAEQTIAIEEPEIHLHPAYQSLLADMFVEAMKKYNIHFIIETHSEYLIRRLQLLTAKKVLSGDESSVVYVDKNGCSYNLGLQDDGKFSRDFGTGFFDEADNAAIELFEITNQ